MNKSKKKSARLKPRGKSVLEQINVNAAGIDIGSEDHFVAVPAERDEKSVRSFKCFTSDLYAMADWLKQCGVTTVAMESTGVYWIPVFQVLEKKGFEVILVNAHHIKNVSGRKTDVSDCQWIQQLHTYGLLQGSFRPNDEICVLRQYVRHRDSLIRSISAHIQRMQKVMTQMNLQLHKVISDITGETGIKIIEAILSGERDPIKLAQMKNRLIKNSVETIAKALTGDWREEHLFTLRQEYDLYKVYEKKIMECGDKIQKTLASFESKKVVKKPVSRKKRKRKYSNQSTFELNTYLCQMTGVDLTTVDGFDATTIQTVISECGLDMSKWPTEKHYASWLGLSPNNKITGGQVKGRSTRKVVNRASNAFRMAAQSLSRSKSSLGAYYRRMKYRIGASKAITATAHKLACIYYRMLKSGKDYIDVGQDYYDQKYRHRVIKNLKRRAKELGYELTENQLVTEGVS